MSENSPAILMHRDLARGLLHLLDICTHFQCLPTSFFSALRAVLASRFDAYFSDAASPRELFQSIARAFRELSAVLSSADVALLCAEMSRCHAVFFRRRLPAYSTAPLGAGPLRHLAELVQSSRRILVVSGAGLSVAAGIPDFRSAGGVYDRIAARFDLPDPHALFDLRYFVRSPQPFYQFAAELFPRNVAPTAGHRFIRWLEEEGRLLRNYTQNIDSLELAAGIERVVFCHGNFSSASCLECRHKVQGKALESVIAARKVPACVKCGGLVKPDIVFFFEKLSDNFYQHLEEDLQRADCLIVLGSSMKVEPVAKIPLMLPRQVPQVLVNRELVGAPCIFDLWYPGDLQETLGGVLAQLQLQKN